MLQKLAPKGSNFTYSPGIDWIGTLVPASELPGGLTRTESDSSVKQVDSTIDYGATSDLKPGVTYTWTGTFSVPSSDTYYLYLQGSIAGGGGFPGGTPAESITIDGATPTSFSPAVPVSTYPSGIIPTGGANTGFIATLTGGPHTVVMITVAVSSTQTTPVYLRFASSQLSVTIDAAASAAAKAKIAVVFADDNGSAGATGAGDEATTNSPIINSLSANQDALIEAVEQANANTVVVLSTGDPVLASWASSVRGILEMWYPGQEGGTSTARLLLGLANPGGKLPISWPASEQQTPFFNHPERITGDGTAVYFSEGIFNGYRWYDQQGITPLFSFGHGLSYTTFEYSNIKIHSSKDGLDVSFTLKNNGTVTGSEVPQVYLGPPAK
jgi:beta-glucosidase